jgi:hypothetical protein
MAGGDGGRPKPACCRSTLEHLTRIKHHRIRISQGEPITGVSAINA